ncbi:MAG: hypothetical protein EXR69_01320 [Myxococcales bacterium]|nr:hypothetical protein [Myxococcales bacterium]
MRSSCLPNVRTILLPILLSVAACTGTTDDTGSGADNGGDNSGDNGGNGDGCGSYIAGVGSVLTYGYVNMGATTGSYVLTFTSLDASTGAAVFTTSSSMAASGYTASSISVQNLSCESDGMYVSSVTTDSEIVSGGTPFSDSTVATYDPPMLVLPSSLAAGSTWEMSSSVTTVGEMSGTGTTTIAQTATVGASESVTVPAGTYDTLPVTFQPTSGAASHSWLAVGVGSVKTDYSELATAQ